MPKTEKSLEKIEFHRGSGNVFVDLGFSPVEVEELTVKSKLISSILETMRRRKLTQVEAAKICRTDQPTLSKILRGRVESVTIDRLAGFLTALGRTVEIRVTPYKARSKVGHLLTVV
jgi:predicted XRE-type DNA-binding protein